ncbi:outer membrane protein [Bradyrhizobium monzae]|uniref:outer membrane protein n=1 Tax=Bradyrhizobium sp. Oc8 TaxID=2876780 RepID=UPI001F474FB1|nr:outer membrane beta-barrel protein [Bradyrhizobium sp. Oc8]
MKSLLLGCAASLVLATIANAADLSPKTYTKAPVIAPASSWTGFYVGGNIGGGWGDPRATYAGNDTTSAVLLAGLLGFPDQQAVASHGINSSGVTGGVELGYNWQVDPRWLIGLETDFSGSGIKGAGSGTSVLSTLLGGFTQTVNAEQAIEWWGTVRARLGFLPHKDLLLFGTAGFAYGRVSGTDTYMFNGAAVPFGGGFGFVTFNCTAGAICFSGSSASVKTGWTAGGGGEWRVAPRWTIKAEYLYVNLGDVSVTAIAGLTNLPGETPSRYTASFREDFHVVRIGANYQF